MMAADKTIEMWALHAYADGELEAHERVEVERQLEHDIDARVVLDSIRREKASMHAAFDKVLTENIPYGLMAAAQETSRRKLAPWAAMAASVAMLVIGASGGWFAGHNAAPDQMAMMSKRALVAHEVYANDARHFVEVSAAESEHLQTWLSKRIGANVSIPDLSDKGYTFLGGRLLAAEDRPAGQLLFEDENKHRVAVFVTLNGDHKDVAMQMEQRGNLWGCYWMDGKFGMAVTGDLPKDDMLALAKDIYDQLEKS
jgi:anti-sigma factor RsiW